RVVDQLIRGCAGPHDLKVSVGKLAIGRWRRRDDVAAHIGAQRVAGRQAVRLKEDRGELSKRPQRVDRRTDVIVRDRRIQATRAIPRDDLEAASILDLADDIAVEKNLGYRPAVDIDPNTQTAAGVGNGLIAD